MYKVKHDLSPLPVREIFTPSPSDKKDWIIPGVRTVNNGLETVRYRGPKTWDLVPQEIKNSKSLIEFQDNIKRWKPMGCTCKLCKVYISDLGYI